MDFRQVYDNLNPAQRQAVDQIDGPLLVVAGPGTGKTQLLSARVANILDKTDTQAANILCLTFTESGAANMRERLSRFIGQAAYDVTISTYHAFGGDILSRYGDYFDDRLDTPIDNLRKHQIIEEIVAGLSYRDALKQTRHHIKDLIATISEVKRALLTPENIRAIARENNEFLSATESQIGEIFSDFKIMPRKLDKALPYFENTLNIITEHIPASPAEPRFGSLAEIAARELQLAINQASEIEKTKPLTDWKNKWLAKNSLNRFTLNGKLENRRLESLANVLEQYQTALAANGFYDFDDMILRAIHTLEAHDDLRFTLQEQYLYILLDEYQDTNAAQARLVELLTDNEVNEGRPNVMAVGDDDQAIYAFQGAQYSNMLDFFNHYSGTRLINLSENYRSHADILVMAENIAEQIDERLFHKFTGTTKTLTASNPGITSAYVERREFKSQIAENVYVAGKIKQLIDKGVKPSEIAVLTPKHSLLERFVPYAQVSGTPLHYEKRENILESQVVNQLLTMSKLVVFLYNDDPRTDSLWPEVLSYDFFKLPISTIWQLGWAVRDHNRANYDSKTSWLEAMYSSENKQLKQIALLFMALSARAQSEPCELMLDYLIGTRPLSINEPGQSEVTSPLYDHLKSSSEQDYYDALSNLTVLRAKLRDYQSSADDPATLNDLLRLVDAYKAADERMLNTSPYHQSDDAVQLMTVFKAKGLEYSHVFLLSTDDNTWGGSGQSMSNKLTLPKNLTPTRHSGATEDERLRLLFVALTRAKNAIYMTSSTSNYSGKATKRLKYLDEREEEDGSFAAYAIPESQTRKVISEDSEPPEIANLETNWQAKHISAGMEASLKDLLKSKLENYQLSPTDLNHFLDLTYGGPQKFLLDTLLRFPSAPSLDGQFGTAIHNTLRWLQTEVSAGKNTPDITQLSDQLKSRLDRLKLPESDYEQLLERGITALESYVQNRGQMFTRGDKAEISFKHENVRIGEAHLTGTIDRMEIDSKARQITVVDFKTGSPSRDKLYRYGRQLYFYKILIENSRTYRGYTVTSGRLEYVEPDISGELPPSEIIDFKPAELERTKQLIEAVWERIQTLEFPDVSDFAASPAGGKQFEQSLLSETID